MVEETELADSTNYTLGSDDMEHLKGGNSLTLTEGVEVSLSSLFWQDAPTVQVVTDVAGNSFLAATDHADDACRVVADNTDTVEGELTVVGTLAEVLDRLDGEGDAIEL